MHLWGGGWGPSSLMQEEGGVEARRTIRLGKKKGGGKEELL